MRVLVDYDELLKHKDECPKLRGTQGFCFVEDGKIYKVYYRPSKELIDFSNYHSDYIAFPINYMVNQKDKSQIVGEEMIYYPKDSISRALDNNIEIQKLKENYSKILEEIYKYSEICMNDLCGPNILYDDTTGFSIIDTSSWKFGIGDYSHYGYNRRLLDNELLDTILDKLEIYGSTIDSTKLTSNLLKYGKNGKKLVKALIAATLDYEVHFLEIIELYELLAMESEEKQLTTLGDIKKYTKKLKNG